MSQGTLEEPTACPICGNLTELEDMTWLDSQYDLVCRGCSDEYERWFDDDDDDIYLQEDDR